MNKNQKIILAIFIPIIILFIALGIANSLGYTEITRKVPESSVFSRYPLPTTAPRYLKGNPFDWENTWYVWVLCLILICIFEYKLFADKKRKINN